MSQKGDLESISQELQKFADDRDWQQFHSPKNLVMALTVETGELLEHFQWLTEEESKALGAEKLSMVSKEIADIQIYLIRLADQLGVDILCSVKDKIEENGAKYPPNAVRGKSKKYTEY